MLPEMTEKKKNKTLLVLVLLLAVAALVAFFWPAFQRLALTLRDQRTEQIDAYVVATRDLGFRREIGEEIAAANAQTMSDGVGIFNPFFDKDVPGFGTLEAFPENKCFGLFYAPEKDVLQPIYLSTGYANYKGGILHFGGTSIPAGGEGTHAVLGGEFGSYRAPILRYLIDLQVGERVKLFVLGDELTYVVTDRLDVTPDGDEPPAQVAGEDRLTLYLATDDWYEKPYRRIDLVRAPEERGPARLNSEITREGVAERLENLHEKSAEKTPLQRFDTWRMILSLLLFAILLGALLFKFAR